MFNKKLLKRSIALAMTFGICIGALTQSSYALGKSAQSNEGGKWYYASITLPRFLTTGDSWWKTTAREGTRSYPSTGYDVIAIIYQGSVNIGGNVTHTATQNTTKWHYTATKNNEIKGAFRSTYANVHTNKVNLRWTP